MSENIPTSNTTVEDGQAKLVYLLVFLASALFIALSVIYHDDWKVLAPFLKEIGFAGLISLIVIFTVENFSRKRHEAAANNLVERINHDLFHAVYKRYIPDAVFTEVEKCLMHSGVYRRGHEVNYTIENMVGEADGVDCSKHVKCLAQSRYTLHNVTEGDVEHPVVLTLERPIDRKWDNLCRIDSVNINGIELSTDDVVTHTAKDEVHVKFRYVVKIPPNGSIDVATSSTLLKQKTDSEIWASRLPSDGFKLTVSMPNKDIQVSATALHSEKLAQILNNEVTKSWELKHGIFPFQSVVFWWHSNKG